MRADVFISHRHKEGWPTAELLWNGLRDRGYRPFLARRSLGAGRFDDALVEAIKVCSDLVLVLSPGALDGCDDPEDWVRMELEVAFAAKKNVIPVVLEGFKWPAKALPAPLAQLPRLQAVVVQPAFVDAALQRLQGYLKARRVWWRTSIARVSAAISSLLMLTLAAMWGMNYGSTFRNPTSSRNPDRPPDFRQLPAGDLLEVIYRDDLLPTVSEQELPALQSDIFAIGQENRSFYEVQDGRALLSDQDDLFVGIRALSRGYLYVFSIGSSGKLTTLFGVGPPGGASDTAASLVDANRVIEIPPQSNGYLFPDHEPGVEHVYLVFSAFRWTALEEQLLLAEQASAHPTAPVQQPNGLGNRGRRGPLPDSDVSFHRPRDGKEHRPFLRTPSVQGTNARVVIERWFRHE